VVATVGSISIELSTNTAKFTQGFKQSASTVDRESKRMANSVNGFAKASAGMFKSFAGGFLGGAAASIGLDSFAAVLGKARQSLSNFEEIGSRAKATGLNAETFQAISHGAALANVEQESLNRSLEIFAKNAGLAEQGTGTMYAGLKKLNPELLRSVLHATDQEQRLKLVADAMAGMTDATEKAALATAIFGRGGAEMVSVLDKGSQSIEEMKRNAAALGIIIPEDLIKRSGELDDQLTTLATVIDVNIKQALAQAGPLLVAGATGLADFAKGVNELTTAFNNFAGNQGTALFLEVLKKAANPLTALNIPNIAADAAGNAFDKMVEGMTRSTDKIQAEIKDVEAEIKRLQATGEGGAGIIIEQDMQRLEELKQELIDLGATATAAGDQVRRAFLASEFRKSENASMAAMNAAGFGALPTVHGGGGAVDESIMDDVEHAIDKETEATNRVAARATDVYRGVQTLDTHTAGYFDVLGSRLESAFSSVEDWVMSSGSGGGGGGGGGRGGSTFAGPSTATTRAFDALSSGSSSWAGRRMTFGGGGGSSSRMTSAFGTPYAMGGNTVGGASAITSGGGAAINVNVTVRPILEGQRLSAQSTAEIKQAASAGANAALRAFNGR
jgi:dGTP triphosphohydrolase